MSWEISALGKDGEVLIVHSSGTRMPCRELQSLMFDILKMKHEDWQSFANDMAEDESIIERVLENKRKGAV